LHGSRRGWHRLVNVSHETRPGIEPDQAHTQRQMRAKVWLVAVMEPGFGDELPASGLQRPLQINGQAPMAGFAWRVLNGRTLGATLQLEATERRRRSQPLRNPAALDWRQWRK